MYVAPWVKSETRTPSFTWMADEEPRGLETDGHLVYQLDGTAQDDGSLHRRQEAKFGLYRRISVSFEAFSHYRDVRMVGTGVRPPKRQRKALFRLWRRVPSKERECYKSMVNCAARVSSALDVAEHDIYRSEALYAGVMKQTATIGYGEPLRKETVEAMGVDVDQARTEATRVNNSVGSSVVRALSTPVVEPLGPDSL